MSVLLSIVIFALLFQIVLFFVIKHKNDLLKAKDSIKNKYNIKSKGDLFKLINSSSIPDSDRTKLEELYQKGI